MEEGDFFHAERGDDVVDDDVAPHRVETEDSEEDEGQDKHEVEIAVCPGVEEKLRPKGTAEFRIKPPGASVSETLSRVFYQPERMLVDASTEDDPAWSRKVMVGDSVVQFEDE